MRFVYLFLFIISGYSATAQVAGKVINALNGEPLPYAEIRLQNRDLILSSTDGSFKLPGTNIQDAVSIEVSHLGFETKTFNLSGESQSAILDLYPKRQKLSTVLLSDNKKDAEELIKRAIENRKINDPRVALKGFEYQSYSKFLIDNDDNPIRLETDSTNSEISTIVMEARAYLSEKVTRHQYNSKKGSKEEVIGLKTAGFKDPIYDVLALDIYPTSFYEKDYSIFKTNYAGPLAKNALKNYEYRILDTLQTDRPSYLVYFKPTRNDVVAGLEGVIYLDTENLGIQKTTARIIGEIDLEINEDYAYNEDKKLWLQKERHLKIRPGTGGKDITIFGGSVSVGTIQRKVSIGSIFSKYPIAQHLYMDASTFNYNYKLDSLPKIKHISANIEVLKNANEKDEAFWERERKEPYTNQDMATAAYVDSIVKAKNIERKIEVKNSLANGYYPLGFWDARLRNIFRYNKNEGIRLGFGGKTNDRFSEYFNLGGYFAYGFKDRQSKYNINTNIYLNRPTSTSLFLGHTRDIAEVGSYEYLKEERKFYIILPRWVNVNFFYNYKAYYAGLEHKINPQLDAEVVVNRTDVFDVNDYAFNYNGNLFPEYTLSTASLAFKWEPFSEFLKTSENEIMVERHSPRITAQIEKGIADFAGGDFNFVKAGLKFQYDIQRLDLSKTSLIVEGNYASGDLPLSHTFHTNPNAPRKNGVLRRFTLISDTSFETMYYNEFFSDRQVMLHFKHQLRPIRISDFFRPEIVFVSKHAIGDMQNTGRHENITFNTLNQGYNEVGMEINKIFSGFGLATAYRYGAYHLPTFNENFALKFTLNISF